MATLWQRACIALARSDRLTARIQGSRALAALARRFVAGPDVAAALGLAESLRAAGTTASLFYLGEYVADPARIAHTVQQVEALIAAAHGAPELHVSVDPSAIGYAISDELGQSHARRLGHALRIAGVRGRAALMLDMEDRDYVERTLALHDHLRVAGVPVAITLQAYLRRSEEDARRLARAGAYVRLVKGAFAGQREWAFIRRADIDAAYLRLADTLIGPEARSAGAYPSFATHDERMIAAIAQRLAAAKVPREGYEFEMLYGVREPLQRQLVKQGHPLRLYVPYGPDWWPYTVRRIGENPANVRMVLLALAGR